jgi:predicted aspartyl protease
LPEVGASGEHPLTSGGVLIRLRYDDTFDPPAPVVPVWVGLSGLEDRVQLPGLVDTGADVSVLPEDFAERHLPIAGVLGVRGVTGDVRDAALYRALIALAGVERTLILPALGREMIVGRDLLASLVVTLDGPARQITLSV